jgi:tRNA G18 (ribose-2'-O)-methylase SpoU
VRKFKNDELGRKSVEDFKFMEKIPLVIVLDNVRSLHNVGSVFRTADAFLCRAVYLCGITACPPHREIEKTALGATESVEWKYFKTTAEALKQLRIEGFELIAVEQTEGGILLEQYMVSRNKKYAIIFGHEMFGVSEEAIGEVDAAIEVAQYGTKHSLNISVCAGIVTWKFYQELN